MTLLASDKKTLLDLIKREQLNIPNANEFSVSPVLEYVLPARSGLQTKSNLSSGNLSLNVNEEQGGDVFQFIFFYATPTI